MRGSEQREREEQCDRERLLNSMCENGKQFLEAGLRVSPRATISVQREREQIVDLLVFFSSRRRFARAMGTLIPMLSRYAHPLPIDKLWSTK